MAKLHEEKKQKSIKEQLVEILTNYRKVIVIGLLAIVIAIAALTVYSVLRERKIDAGTELTEELQEKFQLWTASPETERDDTEEEIENLFSEINSRYSGTFPHQRALMIKGTLLFEKEMWEEAADHFSQIANRYPKSYLAPVALMNKASAFEESGKLREAMEIYQSIVDNYAAVSPDAPRATFSIGRLYEETGQLESAVDAYYELIDSFSESDWTKLARDRIIYIETR
jgi:tetratricopeptide (TPR) repeat protein